jgi:flagellar hook assembly protein FlgD
LPATSDVELAIFNADGQRVLTLVNGARPLGVHTVRWDGRDDRRHYVASGVYFARLAAAGAVTTKRLVFLK